MFMFETENNKRNGVNVESDDKLIRFQHRNRKIAPTDSLYDRKAMEIFNPLQQNQEAQNGVSI